MKPIILNKYSTAAILLFAVAAVFIDIALISNPKDITTTAFVISGMVCAMTGIFTLTFSAGEPVDPRLLGILPAQGCINLYRLTRHLGMHGHAYFLPPALPEKPRSCSSTRPRPTMESKDLKRDHFGKKDPPGLLSLLPVIC